MERGVERKTIDNESEIISIIRSEMKKLNLTKYMYGISYYGILVRGSLSLLTDEIALFGKKVFLQHLLPTTLFFTD